MIYKYLMVISLIFSFGCDTSLQSPKFAPLIQNVESTIVVETIDAFTIRLSWEYDLQNNSEVDGFNIYINSPDSTLDEDDFPITSWRDPIYIDIEQLSIGFDLENTVFMDFDTLAYNRWYYFKISAVVGDNESLEFPIPVGERFLLEAPIINEIVVDGFCEQNSYDDDCLILEINPNSLISSIDSLIFVQKSIFSGTEIIEPLNYPITNETILIGLQICNVDSEILEFEYCKYLPDIDHEFRYYFEQFRNGQSRISDSTIISGISFDRPMINPEMKSLTSESCRLYFNSEDISSSYYHSVNIYNGNTNLTHSIGIDALQQIENEIINEIIIDINDVTDEQSISYLFYGNSSFIYSDGPLILSTLPVEFSGYRLLELNTASNINKDYYMSIYEITNGYYNDFQSGLTDDSYPKECNYSEAKDFIADLNTFYQSYEGFTFRLPTNSEWEELCGWDYTQGVILDYPWGDIIESHNANYLNSQFPVGSNGTTSVGSHAYSNSNGIFDLSGNVMEWVELLNDNDITEVKIRGGAYYSSPDDLTCSKSFNDPDPSNSTGIGFHIILEVNK